MSYLLHLVFSLILFKNVICLIPENLLLNTFIVKDKNYGTNRTEKYLNMTELPTFFGYHVEEHAVKTEDGYILKMLRIPGNRSVVFLMHGIVNSADDFMTLGPDNALSFLLADAGYDVWLGNARGNKYCRQHVTLSPEDVRFWNFSFHEIGIFDLPAMIDYALEKSNKTELTYIGHSQGTTVYFVMASMRPEYNKKVKFMVSLATIAWTSNIISPIVRIALVIKDGYNFISDVLRLKEFLPSNVITRFIFREFCSSSKFALMLCETLLFTVYGFDYGQVNMTQAPVELAHLPAGCSIKQILHFLQQTASGEFGQYDHGTGGNMVAYGMEKPPAYPVNNIKTPIAILYGTNDWLSALPDVFFFIKNVSSVFSLYKVPYERWNHMDYLFAREAKHLVYKKVLTLVKERAGQ
ncbi:Lipase 3 [Operophtera brumata]|uniref:Lipase n=1 Tax=Operophtera brumata TaxID=104452 RepID=A0A0L7LCZ5_OPEBR|nr:Lipase 3 [Operophtera brumata]